MVFFKKELFKISKKLDFFSFFKTLYSCVEITKKNIVNNKKAISDYDQAIKIYEGILKDNPELVEIHYNLGIVLKASDKLADSTLALTDPSRTFAFVLFISNLQNLHIVQPIASPSLSSSVAIITSLHTLIFNFNSFNTFDLSILYFISNVLKSICFKSSNFVKCPQEAITL